MLNKIVKKKITLERKIVEKIDNSLKEQGGNEERLFEIKFDDEKVAKVNICKSYPSYIRVELYSGQEYLDAMEQTDTILGDYIFLTNDGEYILDIE